MGSEDRALRMKAHGTRSSGEQRAAQSSDFPAPSRTPAEQRRESEEYARQAMVSSARAHDRAATLLEEMAAVNPEEAEFHLQSAARHRRWAENDRNLAQKYAPQGGDPDGL
ncbi:hypothetical protein E1293_46695 [Actinomadura darangshiensis]|uniref:Uncharacterized protein n=1 Tax=Actinomadura darangshiensis TaxID=705336 RepID=A0A4R4ZLB1_9ACTN|nr:hypothetical protein [Actinomadura darangshiensis]TDD59000.1 hypothetical protein E1293_46695 [Actinomadura darangshiensis]